MLKRMAKVCAGVPEDRDDHVKVFLGPCTAAITFGAIEKEKIGRGFLLTNPDFEFTDQPVEVSEVYIDTTTCDHLLLERFMTYILNYPPKKGVRPVKIFYQGEFDDLGDNLKNALRNTFEYIKKIER